MRIQPNNDLCGKIYNRLIQCEKNIFFRYIAKPAVLGIPPLLTTAFYSNKSIGNFITTNVPSLAEILQDFSLLAIFFAALYPGILVAITQSLTTKAKPQGPDVETLLALLSTIDSIVGAKLNRFNRHMGKGANFCTIADPQKQIEELVRGVCEFFNSFEGVKKKSLIRVVLATFEQGKITAIPIFFPQDEPVRSSVEDLNDNKSAFRLAERSKKIIVIEDISKEIKKKPDKVRYKKTETDDDCSGSLICFPIRFDKTGEVPFVLSIHSEQPGFFKENMSKAYEMYLQRFAIRLSLEYSLLRLESQT